MCSLLTVERHDSEMALIAPSACVRQLLAVTRLDTIFAIYDSEAEVLVRIRPTVVAAALSRNSVEQHVARQPSVGRLTTPGPTSTGTGRKRPGSRQPISVIWRWLSHLALSFGDVRNAEVRGSIPCRPPFLQEFGSWVLPSGPGKRHCIFFMTGHISVVVVVADT